MEKKITDPFILRGILAGLAVAMISGLVGCFVVWRRMSYYCLLYTSDAADDMQCVDLGGRRIIKKKGVGRVGW